MRVYIYITIISPKSHHETEAMTTRTKKTIQCLAGNVLSVPVAWLRTYERCGSTTSLDTRRKGGRYSQVSLRNGRPWPITQTMSDEEHGQRTVALRGHLV